MSESVGAPTPRSAGAALLGGALLGTAVVSLVLASVRRMLAEAPASDAPVLAGPAFPLLLWGTFGAVALAAAATAWRLGPLHSPYRRLALGMAAGLGTILAALLAAPLHEVAGRAGLYALAAAALPAALLALRRH
ncbi:MAG: hypothetical protein MUC69_00785 [Gemmatimonadales bacterium]|nr:hypothetical protein [Gemmatimonadales bacterium]